jgi:hypothetical protein
MAIGAKKRHFFACSQDLARTLSGEGPGGPGRGILGLSLGTPRDWLGSPYPGPSRTLPGYPPPYQS